MLHIYVNLTDILKRCYQRSNNSLYSDKGRDDAATGLQICTMCNLDLHGGLQWLAKAKRDVDWG